jgi:Spy/CpxP family protein refolding chaperone
MKNWKAILGICAVFVLGMIAGGLLTIGVGIRIVQRVQKAGPGEIDKMIVQRVSHELRLDKEQREKLQPIVADAHAKIRAAHRTINPEVAGILQKAATDARAILKPEQTKKFDEFLAKNRARWQEQ